MELNSNLVVKTMSRIHNYKSLVMSYLGSLDYYAIQRDCSIRMPFEQELVQNDD